MHSEADDGEDLRLSAISHPEEADRAARHKLRAMPDTLVCDALLDQNVFAGVGNIIKNEVLFRIGVHPLSTIGGLPVAKLQAMVREARVCSFDCQVRHHGRPSRAPTKARAKGDGARLARSGTIGSHATPRRNR